MRSAAIAVAVVCGLLSASAVAFASAAGDPDPSFGTNGVVTTRVGDVSEANDLVRQADGKLVVGGYVEQGMPRAARFLLVRYDADGALDAGFGTGGIVQTDALPGWSTRVTALLLQADGKLVAVGFGSATDYWDGGGDVVLARYLPDGSLDPDFGLGGIVVTDVFGYPDQGTKAVLQPDGAIVVVGFTWTGATVASQDALIARYEDDGTLDAGFGSGGIVTLDLDGRIDRAYAAALQPDGAIVVAGTSWDPTNELSGLTKAFLARVDADGVPDASFGTGGIVTPTLGVRSYLNDLLRLPNGDLFALGTRSDDGISGTTVLVRFDADGGIAAIIDPAPNLFFGLRLAPDGGVLGAGPGFLWGHWQALGVGRVDANGVPDPGFGHGGLASVFPGGNALNAGSFAVAAEPDGSAITMAGFATDGPYVEGIGEPRYIALARVLGSSPACAGDGDCDACEHCAAGVCANGPRTTCERPLGKGAKVLYAGGPVKPRIQWKWQRTSTAPGFDPQTDAVGFCMWWGEIPVYESSVPPGGGWKVSANGAALFQDKTRANFGLEKIKVGKTIEVRAAGNNVKANPNGFPDALLQPGDSSIPLHVQLNAASGKCYYARYFQASMSATYNGHKRRGLGY